MKPIWDVMDYTATRASGEPPTKPALWDTDVTPANLQGSGWYSDTSTVDAAAALTLGNSFTPTGPTILDAETWIEPCYTTDGQGRPLAASAGTRQTYIKFLADSKAAIAASPIAARSFAKGFGFYLSFAQAYNPDNGNNWIPMWMAANDTVVGTPYSFAPLGIRSLITCSIVSLYHGYVSDPNLEYRRITGLIAESRRLFPDIPTYGFIWPRYPQGYETANDAFDFVSFADGYKRLWETYDLVDGYFLFDFNGYGPPGVKSAGRYGNGYATVGAAGWRTFDLPWWQAFQQFKLSYRNSHAQPEHAGPSFRSPITFGSIGASPGI